MKNSTSNQNYEEYWSLTNAFTNYNGKSFLTVLEVCINFIYEFKNEPYSEEKYSRLQIKIKNELHLNLISIRKAINQLVKMGFINSFLISYNQDAVEYLNAKTNRKRRSIFSKIVYSNSSFNRSVNNDSTLHQLNFLINTLVENGKLNIEEIIALMLVDIGSVQEGFLNRSELNDYVARAKKIDFIKRKYNQIGYLTNLLKKLDDICFVNNELYFTEDAKQIFGENLENTTRKRNPYLHLLYKNQLKEESFSVFKEEKCMVEKLAYPILIASHIKPFIKSSEEEAYDPNNGLLLSQNLDGLFDKGYISFQDDGTIILSERLSSELKTSLEKYTLDEIFIGNERKKYLSYHRSLFKMGAEEVLSEKV